jgi:hypothetical protein
MKLLFDEYVPQRLSDYFPNHDVYTAEAAGLLGVKNGALLRAANAAAYSTRHRHDRLFTSRLALMWGVSSKSWPDSVRTAPKECMQNDARQWVCLKIRK